MLLGLAHGVPAVLPTGANIGPRSAGHTAHHLGPDLEISTVPRIDIDRAYQRGQVRPRSGATVSKALVAKQQYNANALPVGDELIGGTKDMKWLAKKGAARL